MVKILSQSGSSLADMYDVVGSVAGIDSLESREVALVHEMGATIFSERFGSAIRRLVTGAVAQNTAFDVVLTNLPNTVVRVFGITVYTDQNVGSPSRIVHAAVLVREPITPRETALWTWDTSVDDDVGLRIDGGTGVSSRLSLRPVAGMKNLPGMLTGSEQPFPQRVSDLALRGVTSGFGAGTVTITAEVQIGFTQTTALSSRGLPIPGW